MTTREQEIERIARKLIDAIGAGDRANIHGWSSALHNALRATGEPAGTDLDVAVLADIAVMALGEVTTGDDYARYHEALRQHFLDRLTRASHA